MTERREAAPAQADARMQEALEHLRAYLRFDTTNPPGREAQPARHFLELLRGEGVEAQVLEPAGGRASLVARIPGRPSAEGPVVLLHHADVVPADPSEWSAPPFGALVRDGYLYGRGALDMKSTGIVHLMTFLDLHRRQAPLRRDLVLLMVADEETGGRLGTCHLLDALPWLASASLVLDEGGVIVPGGARDGCDLYCVSVAEKSPLQLLLRADGASGHGSVPGSGTATERLARALCRILSRPAVPRVHDVVRAYFEMAAAPGSAPGAVPGGGVGGGIEDPGVIERFCRDPVHRALVNDTVVCTLLKAGGKINVVPSTAEAGLDCRLLPDTDPDAFLAGLCGLVRDLDLRLDLMTREEDSGVSPPTGEFMRAMADCVAQESRSGAVVPYLMTGAADGRYFRRLGVPTYGFEPFRLTREEQARIHGVDERISLENLSFGLDFFARLVGRLLVEDGRGGAEGFAAV